MKTFRGLKMLVKLHHGDCLQIMEKIPTHSIDFCLTDPPYGTTACKWDSVISFIPMWEQLNRVMKPNGAIALFGSEPFSSALRMSNIKQFKYDWVWYKNHPSGFALAKKQPMRNHEMISLFYKKQVGFNSIKEPRDFKAETRVRYAYKSSKGRNTNNLQNGISNVRPKIKDIDLRNATTVKYFKSLARCKLKHPTQKPVELLEYLIKTYTRKGETVLDFTMGSGSTGVAARNLNRKFIGIEKEKKYFNIARKRINV